MFAVLRSSTWGWLLPKADAPDLFGLSVTLWMVLVGGAVLRAFLAWEQHRIARKREPLVDPAMLRNRRLRGGMTVFFFQFLLQAGLFFVVPLFLSVSLGLSALETGVRLLPLSITLLLAAAGIPKLWPDVSPRLVVQFGLFSLFAALVALLVALEGGSGAEITTVPMLLAGLGIGSIASQLGSVTVSSVPEEQTGEVGGLQNTATNLGASVGSALAGSVLIAALTTSFLTGIEENPAVPESVTAQAEVSLASGAPFVSDETLEETLAEIGLAPDTADAVIEENKDARVDALRLSLAVLAVIATMSLFFTRAIPTSQPGGRSRRPEPVVVTHDRPADDTTGLTHGG